MLQDKNIGFVSDIDSTQTLYAIMKRLPTHLRQKWVDRTVHFSARDVEPKFTDLMCFINERAIAVKSSFGQELIRLQSSEKRTTTEVKKQISSEKKPAKTLATTTTPAKVETKKEQKR